MLNAVGSISILNRMEDLGLGKRFRFGSAVGRDFASDFVRVDSAVDFEGFSDEDFSKLSPDFDVLLLLLDDCFLGEEFPKSTASAQFWL